MKRNRGNVIGMVLFAILATVASCSDDNKNEADRKGVGAQCAKSEDCATGQTCLAFKGGYCGVNACTADTGCPVGSACVRHSDGTNYCFRVCVDKAECNVNRDAVNESNCSSSVTFVDTAKNRKACVPPSSSTL